MNSKNDFKLGQQHSLHKQYQSSQNLAATNILRGCTSTRQGFLIVVLSDQAFCDKMLPINVQGSSAGNYCHPERQQNSFKCTYYLLQNRAVLVGFLFKPIPKTPSAENSLLSPFQVAKYCHPERQPAKLVQMYLLFVTEQGSVSRFSF